MSDKQIFEEKTEEKTEMGKGVAEPDEPINKKKKRQPMSESRKAQLRVQLEKARAVSLEKRKAKAKKKKLDTVQEEEVKGLLETNSAGEETHEEIIKKPRKKNIRYVEETEQEMESRIEKRIRERLQKEKEKEEKERLRNKELEDLRNENAQLKANKNIDKIKKEEKIKMEVKQSVVNPRPVRNQFSTFGRRR
tara:strand:+ start:120 stop:698 length:579 start_codon:yes stop_codon:yes gene_type:complete